ncbi:cytochrome c [Paenibacillus dokdonensis]|uniref:Cytochrome c n=1 Tax=Paenibacillus dokdonensis TaxID=2567944 RepID=A0ABU6GJB3_9BACL|nr:cytochrome c [Paenibacillus dokdonensis]MEC0239839.1 cytochrome c [Paenibacillus dokdonensis]
MKMRLPLFAVSIITVFILAACGSHSNQQNQTNTAVIETESDLTAVDMLYKKNCLSCHAADLSGKVGPNLKEIGSKLSKEEIIERITLGRSGMPSFKNRLSEQDIEALGSWLADKK